ncbi:MAG: Fe(2+) transporter permease subunit FeoB [Candidatus Cloacimonetes bacterium]|nr:Fe(2+) transporter permease subunit FeoB [Candidatus Cloacimonadota bacterium]
MDKMITIALVGNPNCGKTTLFNVFTGSKQRVGNWPGVTVEHKEGVFKHKNETIQVIDLPGIYSFSAFSPDEKVSREYILRNTPDLVINILDASNLERNLYLTTQLIEMKVPILIALNMMDMAKEKRITIEIDHLSKHLGIPIIPIIAGKKTGIDELKDKIIELAHSKPITKTRVFYDSYLETCLQQLEAEVSENAAAESVDERWLAVKLLENDELANQITKNRFENSVKNFSKKIEKHTGDSCELVIADGRYGFIHGLAKDVVKRDNQLRKTISDSIDNIVLNRLLGLPLFLGIMYLVFYLTINLGEPFINFFDSLFGTIFVDGFAQLLNSLNFPNWAIVLLADGIGGGIQTVATFVPPIFFMFLSLSFLEDSGYMARAAFVMDKFMRYIGLPGKAFIPMLIGFGCNVPAIMATRTLENENDRLHTILINPLMSCGARMPVYALFAAVFFPSKGGFVIFSLYVTGILLAIITGLVFKKTILKGDITSFVMELPTYHIPTFNGVFLHTWLRLRGFIYRAGKVILFFIIIISFLNSISSDWEFGNQEIDKSMLSGIGKIINPVFRPMGITDENWPATVGLITGIFAKESVVGTLDLLYSGMAQSELGEDETDFNFRDGVVNSFKTFFEGEGDEEDDLLKTVVQEEMVKQFGGSRNAFAYLLFILIYTPCIAVIAAIYRETNLFWAVFNTLYLTTLAWVTAVLFYNTSMIFEQPSQSFFWIAICLIMILFSYFALRIWGNRRTA